MMLAALLAGLVSLGGSVMAADMPVHVDSSTAKW